MADPDIPKINETIARTFLKIETNIAMRRSVVELFEGLLIDIETEFGIPFVWLSLMRLPETTGLLRSLADSALLSDRLNIIEEERYREIVPDLSSPLLASGRLRPYFRLLPKNRKYFIRSLAIAPISINGRLIGSMNHGDASPSRYAPGMDTTLLMHLARSVSDHLTKLLPPLSAHDA